MKRGTILFLPMLAGALLVSCVTKHHHHSPPPVTMPPWTQVQKPNDSVNMYRVGFAHGEAAASAREAAYQDALRQITQAVMVEVRGAAAGSGTEALTLSGAEVMPGCSHVVPTSSGYEAWVQVGFPLTEKRRLVESSRRK
jgi:hypothetical protein